MPPDVDALEAKDLDPEDPDELHGLAIMTDDRSFKVTVQMPKYQYSGLLLEAPGGPYLRVTKIDAFSSIAEYNRNRPFEERVRSGDFVIAVNDVTVDSEGMCLELSAGGAIELTLSRAVEVAVPELNKVDGGYGLDVSHQKGTNSVVIRAVLPDGAVARWNETVEADKRIWENDHIVFVDGHSGTPQELVRRMQELENPSLIVSRPAMGPRSLASLSLGGELNDAK